jgi:23S rRNA (uracil1939-C5)-methyltransferase
VTEAYVQSLDREGRGVARHEGKAIFIDGALPGETVDYAPYRRKENYELAQISAILKPSAARIVPKCQWFGRCGGCSMQHADIRTQVAAKQRVLEDALWHIGRVRPGSMLSPVIGPEWGYRHRARLSVRLVPKKGGVLVGFHERKSSYVADMTSCEILPPAISAMIPALRDLVGRLTIRDRLPQVEVSIGERVGILVMRILAPPSAEDENLLRQFAELNALSIWLQVKGPDTAQPFWPLDAPVLDYAVPEYGVRIAFLPTDFTQVNHSINRILIRRAMGLLDPRAGDRVADFFCGIGNFTLPIASLGARVIGIEGSASLVERAKVNALSNQLDHLAYFGVANLFDADACRQVLESAGPLDKVLIDPPREGAVERIVYVSCDPATLARDAGVLTQTHGYVLNAAGVVNMFPQTSHVESIAVFDRE